MQPAEPPEPRRALLKMPEAAICKNKTGGGGPSPWKCKLFKNDDQDQVLATLARETIFRRLIHPEEPAAATSCCEWVGGNSD